MGSFGAFRRSLWVVALIQVRWVHSGTPFGSAALFRFVGCRCVHSGSFLFILARSCGRQVNLVSLVSFRSVQTVDAFIQARTWGRRLSFGRAFLVIVFILVRWVHLGALCVSLPRALFLSLGSLGRAHGVVGFIRSSPWFIRVRWVHLGALCEPLPCTLFVVGFIRARQGGGTVHSCALRGLLVLFLFVGFILSSGSFGIVWFISERPGGRWVL